MYYIVRVWDGTELEYEQEFPPELKDNEIRARRNFDSMKRLYPGYKVSFTSQAVSIYV